MKISSETCEKTTFLNVDLDIYSKTNLKPLVSALGKQIFALHLGREGNAWSAHLELSVQPRNADAAIRRFAALIRALPRDKRRLWDTATTRDFNIGVQAGARPRMLDIKLTPQTIRVISSLNARVVLTVYGKA